MSATSKIEWTDSTWNPIRARNRATSRIGWHCTHVSEGCRNCYAEGFNRRLGTGLGFKPEHEHDIQLFLDEAMLMQPLRWRRPRMIFVGSMTDLFADFVTDAMLDRVFAVMALCPQHIFQLLTKRPGRMRAYLSEHGVESRVGHTVMDIAPVGRDIRPASLSWTPRCAGRAGCHDFNGRWPLPNVWLGVSAEDQATADARVPELLATPAAVRFVSAEPLLGPIDFTEIVLRRDGQMPTPLSMRLGDYVRPLAGCFTDSSRLDWIIVGGESGPRARPMHPHWACSIRVQCAAAGISFYFKQWGEWAPADDYASEALEDMELRGLVMADDMVRVGKKAAGRLLDGVEHNGMPQVRA